MISITCALVRLYLGTSYHAKHRSPTTPQIDALTRRRHPRLPLNIHEVSWQRVTWCSRVTRKSSDNTINEGGNREHTKCHKRLAPYLSLLVSGLSKAPYINPCRPKVWLQHGVQIRDFSTNTEAKVSRTFFWHLSYISYFNVFISHIWRQYHWGGACPSEGWFLPGCAPDSFVVCPWFFRCEPQILSLCPRLFPWCSCMPP